MIQQAVILAGGLGTRLGKLTAETPKPLLDVAGRPFICGLLDELRRHGVQRILVLAGFCGDQIAAALADHADVEVLIEPKPLGTGGALRFAVERLDDKFFFLNGDSLFDINLLDLALLAKNDVEAALALRPVDDGSRYGEVVLAGSIITDFRERPFAPGPTLINGGVAVLSRSIIDRMEPDGAVSIERDIYPELASTGCMRGRAYDRPFLDIGVPEDFALAQTKIPAMLSRSAVIFDRDGVLNVDINYAHRPDQIQWIEGAFAAVKAVNDAGLFAYVATNQAGVARGFYGEQEVIALHQWMNSQMMEHGAHIDAFEYSPYHPDGVVRKYSRPSECRKPNPGMLNRLLSRPGVVRDASFMIGDKASDMAAAAAASIDGVLFDGDNLMKTIASRLAL